MKIRSLLLTTANFRILKFFFFPSLGFKFLFDSLLCINNIIEVVNMNPQDSRGLDSQLYVAFINPHDLSSLRFCSLLMFLV